VRASSFVVRSFFLLGALFEFAGAAALHGQGALPPAPRARQVHVKHVLVIGQTKGFEHDSISA